MPDISSSVVCSVAMEESVGAGEAEEFALLQAIAVIANSDSMGFKVFIMSLF